MNDERESLEHFFHAAEDFFVVFDKNSSFLDVNRSFIRTTGNSQEILQSQTLLDLTHNNDKTATKEKWDRLISTGIAVYLEHRLKTNRGEYRSVSWTMTPIEEKIYAIGRDITTSKNEQNQLVTAQNRLRLLHQATSHATETLWQKIDEVLLLGVKELKMELGSISKVIGSTHSVFASVTIPEYKGTKAGSFEDTLDSVTVQSGNTISVHDLASSVYAEHPAIARGIQAYIGVPVLLHGDIYGVLSFESTQKRDQTFPITDYDFMYSMGQWTSSAIALILAQEEIAYTAAIVTSSEDAIIAQTRSGIITSWNKGAQRLLGYTAEQVIGKPYTVIIPDNEIEGINDLKNRLLQGEQIDHHDTYYKRNDNSVLDVSLTMSPIVNEDNEFIGFSAIARDITKEKLVDKAKTEFVSLASHQLRTPLSAIRWYAELLLNNKAGKLNDTQRDFVQEIYTGNDRMVELVNSLLNVSRLELGTFTVNPENVDISSISRSLIKELAHEVESKKLAVIEKYDPETPLIQADPNLVRIMVQNLLTNAVKYTPEKGTIQINIYSDADSKTLRIEVSDTGYGIPRNQQSQIFKKLFRADNIKAHDTNGNGLGLYMIKSILEETGGSITFESEENKGTTFFITMPLSGMKPRDGQKKLE